MSIQFTNTSFSCILIVFCCVFTVFNEHGIYGKTITEKNCEVCVKFTRKFADSLAADRKSNPKHVETDFKAYCKSPAARDDKDNRFCYAIGGLDISATYIVRKLSEPVSWGMPAEKVCERLLVADGQICDLAYEKPVDLVGVDIRKMRVKQLKKVLSGWGLKCDGCTEKSEFVRMVEQHLEEKDPAAFKARAAAEKKEL